MRRRERYRLRQQAAEQADLMARAEAEHGDLRSQGERAPWWTLWRKQVRVVCQCGYRGDPWPVTLPEGSVMSLSWLLSYEMQQHVDTAVAGYRAEQS